MFTFTFIQRSKQFVGLEFFLFVDVVNALHFFKRIIQISGFRFGIPYILKICSSCFPTCFFFLSQYFYFFCCILSAHVFSIHNDFLRQMVHHVQKNRYYTYVRIMFVFTIYELYCFQLSVSQHTLCPQYLLFQFSI